MIMMSNSDSSNFIYSDGLITQTTVEQQKIEEIVDKERKLNNSFIILRKKHINYIVEGLNRLSSSCMSMDSSRSWFCFWGVHSLQLLGYKIDKGLATKIITFLKTSQSPTGGYAGAPGQMPHLATTYASVMTLASIGSFEALNSIDRTALRAFINSMRQKNGSFSIHKDGESDVRATYCALAVAYLCNLNDFDELFKDTAAWLIRCQTYEGGFAGEPNCEAHGGYTFCAVAALAILNKIHLVNFDSILRWIVFRQMHFEGGFQGRTNKLVDVCYSYWQAACFCALEHESFSRSKVLCLFDVSLLQSYILLCQSPSGGFRDKPNKNPDMYHTCYALSGLSIAQSFAQTDDKILGGKANILEPIHPLYNITISSYENVHRYFNKN